jgi:hypothetical protein
MIMRLYAHYLCALCSYLVSELNQNKNKAGKDDISPKHALY